MLKKVHKVLSSANPSVSNANNIVFDSTIGTYGALVWNYGTLTAGENLVKQFFWQIFASKSKQRRIVLFSKIMFVIVLFLSKDFHQEQELLVM